VAISNIYFPIQALLEWLVCYALILKTIFSEKTLTSNS